MAVATTGSTVQGLLQGMAHNLVGNVAGAGIFGISEIMNVTGDPDGIVTSAIQSGVAYDVANGNLYMAKTTGGSTWFRLISGT